MKASNISEILHKSLDFRAKKHNVISSNIANINTPGYKEKDLAFNDVLKSKMQQNEQNYQSKHSSNLALAATDSKHITSFDQPIKPGQYKVVQTGNEYEQNDENNVNLDRQMAQMAQNNMMVNALSSAIKKDVRWMKLVIEASGKN
jgi:flagellar basal-body rod protein FlgB